MVSKRNYFYWSITMVAWKFEHFMCCKLLMWCRRKHGALEWAMGVPAELDERGQPDWPLLPFVHVCKNLVQNEKQMERLVKGVSFNMQHTQTQAHVCEYQNWENKVFIGSHQWLSVVFRFGMNLFRLTKFNWHFICPNYFKLIRIHGLCHLVF